MLPGFPIRLDPDLRNVMAELRIHSGAVLALSCTALLSSCGGESGGGANVGKAGGNPLFTAASVPDDVAKLVPAGTPVAVYVNNPGELLAEVRAIAKSIRPGSEAMVNVDTLLSQTPFDLRERDLDLAQPMALLVNENGPTQAIVGAPDPSDLEDDNTATSGKHIALAMPMPGVSKPTVGTASPLVQNLPAADVTIRVDLGAFRAQIEQGEAMFKDLMASEPGGEAVFAVYQPIFDWAKQGGTIDVMLDLDDGDVNLATVIELSSAMPQASPGAPNVAELLARIPVGEDGAMVFAMGPAMSKMADWFDFEQLMGQMFEGNPDAPEQFTAAMQEYARAAMAIYQYMDGPGAGSFAFGENGMNGVWAMSVSDPGAASAAVRDMARALGKLGMTGEPEYEELSIGGAAFDYVACDWDVAGFAKMLEMPSAGGGEMADATTMIKSIYGERLQGAIGQVDDLLVTSFGQSKTELEGAIATLKGGSQNHGDAARALAAVPGDEVVFFMHMDFLGLMRSMVDKMAALENLPGGPPEIPDGKSPMLMSAGRTGNKLRIDVRFDLASMTQLGR